LLYAVVFGALGGIFIEKVKAEGVFIHFDFVKQPVTQRRPFLLTNLTFKDGFLDARAIVFARSGDTAQAATSGFFDGGNIVCYQDQHGARLFGDEGQVIRQIGAKVAGQEARLDEGQLGNAQVLVQQRMVEALLFAFLVGFDDKFAPGVGEFHGSAFAHGEMVGLNLLSVDECDGEAVSKPGAEFFHEVEGEGGAIGSVHMEKPNEWIEADAGERGDTIVTHKGVEK
jgi:hypothetical protein